MNNLQEKKQRIEEFDLIKAFAIIMMVWGHIGLPGVNFIYLFHMAVFFIVSGCVYKERYSESFSNVLQLIRNKIKNLYVPYAFWTIVFLLLNNYFLQIGFYDTSSVSYQNNKELIINCIEALLFAKNTQLSGAFWFLRALFFVSVFYNLLEYLMKRLNLQNTSIILFSIDVFLLCILFIVKDRFFSSDSSLYYFFSNIALGSVMFSFGVILSRYQVFFKIKSIRKSILFFVFTLSFVILLSLTKFGIIRVNKGIFTSPLFYIISSSFGFILLYSFSKIIKEIKIIKTILLLIGQNTLPIVILHLLIFKIFNLLFVIIYDMDYSLISSFPTLYGKVPFSFYQKLFISILYLLFGIFIPILLNIFKKTILKVVWRKHD